MSCVHTGTHAVFFFFLTHSVCDNNPAKSVLLLFSFNNGDYGKGPKFNLIYVSILLKYVQVNIFRSTFIIKREGVHKNINCETKAAPAPCPAAQCGSGDPPPYLFIPKPVFEPPWDSAPNFRTVSTLVMLMKSGSCWYLFCTGVLEIWSGNLWGSEML